MLVEIKHTIMFKNKTFVPKIENSYFRMILNLHKVMQILLCDIIYVQFSFIFQNWEPVVDMDSDYYTDYMAPIYSYNWLLASCKSFWSVLILVLLLLQQLLLRLKSLQIRWSRSLEKSLQKQTSCQLKSTKGAERASELQIELWSKSLQWMSYFVEFKLFCVGVDISPQNFVC